MNNIKDIVKEMYEEMLHKDKVTILEWWEEETEGQIDFEEYIANNVDVFIYIWNMSEPYSIYSNTTENLINFFQYDEPSEALKIAESGDFDPITDNIFYLDNYQLRGAKTVTEFFEKTFVG